MVKTRKASCTKDGEDQNSNSAKRRKLLVSPDVSATSPPSSAERGSSGVNAGKSGSDATIALSSPEPKRKLLASKSTKPQSEATKPRASAKKTNNNSKKKKEHSTSSPETTSTILNTQIPKTVENRDERRCAGITRALLKLDSAVVSAWYPSNGDSAEASSRNRKDAQSECNDLNQLMQDNGMPVLTNFFELGGVLRSISFIKRCDDDDSIMCVGDLFHTCLYLDTFHKDLKWDDLEFARISSETAKVIVGRRGLRYFLQFINRQNEWLEGAFIDPDQKKDDRSACQQTVADSEAHTSTERRQKNWKEQDEFLYDLDIVWALIWMVFHKNPQMLEVLSVDDMLSLFDSALTTLELTGKLIDCNIKTKTNCLDAEPFFDSAQKMAFVLMSNCFNLLIVLIKRPSIDGDESFRKIDKGILKKCVGFVKGRESFSNLMYAALKFLTRFVEKFQLKTLSERFQWFWHADVLYFLIRCFRVYPDYVNEFNRKHWDYVQSTAFELVEWISSDGVIAKSALLEEFGMATALSAVLESKHDNDEFKKRAKLLLKSLCE